MGKDTKYIASAKTGFLLIECLVAIAFMGGVFMIIAYHQYLNVAQWGNAHKRLRALALVHDCAEGIVLGTDVRTATLTDNDIMITQTQKKSVITQSYNGSCTHETIECIAVRAEWKSNENEMESCTLLIPSKATL
jgi:Tfp pilus assembly protein PilE